MKTSFPIKYLLPALYFALSAGAAQAAQIDAAHLQLTSIADYDANNSRPQELSLLSDSNGVTQISLSSLQQSMNIAHWDYGWQGTENYFGMFQIGMQAGYRLTGYSVTGSFGGMLDVGGAPAGAYVVHQGFAHNAGQINTAAYTSLGGMAVTAQNAAITDINGGSDFSVNAGNLNLSNDFVLQVNGSGFVSATPTDWFHVWGDGGYLSGATASNAMFNLGNPVLTLYTEAIAAPVPEPESYAMMLAGLAAVGVLVRRRKQI